MTIRLKVTQTNRKLRDLVKGDVLFFPNSKRLDETVMITDMGKGDLFTRRIRGNIEERVLYHLQMIGEDYILNSQSEGYVYYTKRIGEKKK